MRLPLLVLLLATVACQRASYPMLTGGGYAAQPASPNPAAARQPTAPAVPKGPTATAGPAASTRRPLLKRRQRIPARYSSVPGRATHGRAIPAATTTARRRWPSLHRGPAISEDTKFGLICYGIGALLVAAGLTLAIGLGGGLAVAGGIVLILLGLTIALFWLYATALDRNMGH